MATLAAWMLIAFAALTLGVRVAIQLQRTGRTGLVGLRRGGPVAFLSGLFFVGGISLGVISITLVLHDSIARVGPLDTDGVHGVGIVLAAAAGLAVFAAQVGMGESWRIGVSPEERTELVTGGWFSIVRNPIYSAMILGWTGFALMVPTWLAFTAIVVVTLGLELQVRAVEEPYLMRAHGDDYRAYASRVGRFVPGLGRLGEPGA